MLVSVNAHTYVHVQEPVHNGLAARLAGRYKHICCWRMPRNGSEKNCGRGTPQFNSLYLEEGERQMGLKFAGGIYMQPRGKFSHNQTEGVTEIISPWAPMDPHHNHRRGTYKKQELQYFQYRFLWRGKPGEVRYYFYKQRHHLACPSPPALVRWSSPPTIAAALTNSCRLCTLHSQITPNVSQHHQQVQNVFSIVYSWTTSTLTNIHVQMVPPYNHSNSTAYVFH